MPPVVAPPHRGLRVEPIHGALVLALLIHALGLAAWWLRTGEPEDRALRVVAPVELVDSLPPPPAKPAPIRVPAPPPPPPAVVEPAALPAVVSAAPASAAQLPSASRTQGAAAPPALPGPAAPPALPGAAAPRAGPRRSPGRTATSGAAAQASPSPSPGAVSGAVAARPSTGAASPAATGPGTHRWAWVPGPDQARPVNPGTAPPGEGVGRARAWVELRIPANDGRPVAPSDIRVLEIELLDDLPVAGREARVRARAEAVARTSRWKPGTRDRQPADSTVQLFLEFGGP